MSESTKEEATMEEMLGKCIRVLTILPSNFDRVAFGR
jgi:hypothetical protein